MIKQNIYCLTNDTVLSKKMEIFTTNDLFLPSGVYKFKIRVDFLDKDRSNIEIMAANWKTGKVFAGKNCYRSEQVVLDVHLDRPEELEFRATLFESTKTKISNVSIDFIVALKKEFNDESIFSNLADNPEVLFILEDEKAPAGCVHQGMSAISSYLKMNNTESHCLLTSMCDRQLMEYCINRYKYKFIAFSVLDVADRTVSLANLVKAIRPETKIIFGGPQVTIAGKALMEDHPVIDYCILGEGEKPTYELLSGKSLDQIKGIGYRIDKNIFMNDRENDFLPIEDLPLVRRDNYIQQVDWKFHSLLTSRGCPYLCHFCSSSRIWGSRIRFRPLEHVEKELLWLYGNCDRDIDILINDDMFNLNKNRTLLMMEVFRKYPFRYCARGCRADKIDNEVAKAMACANIASVGIGIESADNDSLKMMRKGETIEQIEAGIDALKKYGIGISGQFIIGNIGDTLATVKKSVDFAKRKKIQAGFYSAILYKGTPLAEYVLSKGYQFDEPYNVIPESPSTQVFFDTPTFPLADRIEAIKYAFDAGFISTFDQIKKTYSSK